MESWKIVGIYRAVHNVHNVVPFSIYLAWQLLRYFSICRPVGRWPSGLCPAPGCCLGAFHLGNVAPRALAPPSRDAGKRHEDVV